MLAIFTLKKTPYMVQLIICYNFNFQKKSFLSRCKTGFVSDAPIPLTMVEVQKSKVGNSITKAQLTQIQHLIPAVLLYSTVSQESCITWLPMFSFSQPVNSKRGWILFKSERAREKSFGSLTKQFMSWVSESRAITEKIFC